MEPYFEDFGVTLYLGDCIDVMKQLPENSIDTIICDPPYGLAMMNKKWDTFGGGRTSSPGIGKRDTEWPNIRGWNQFRCLKCGHLSHGGSPCQCDKPEMRQDMTRWYAFQEWSYQWAVEALRVAKPGACLLAMGGTRTHHRLMCAIEDAGWEIRDCLMWLYGCLSEDTEVLTEGGFRHFHKITKRDRIATYDIENDIYAWETPKWWQVYHLNQDTVYRIRSDKTDQIVSRDHRCLVEQDGKLTFRRAQNLDKVVRVPILQSDFPNDEKVNWALLLKKLFRKGQRLVSRYFASWKGWVDRGKQEKLHRKNVRCKQSCLERWRHLSKTKRKLCQSIHKVCSLPAGIYQHGTQGWLCYGASTFGSTGNWSPAPKVGVCPPHQSQRRGQSSGKPDAVQIEQGTQTLRSRESYTTTLATVTPVEYSGLVFCPTVSTGAFIARRNGEVFITGNSGFPKSHNISKAIDKAAGAEREIIRVEDRRSEYDGRERKSQAVNTNWRAAEGRNDVRDVATRVVTAPTTSAAQLWDGWGTALKPSFEPVILAMKPRDGTFANNALEWGVAGLWIDGGRISVDPNVDDMLRKTTRGKRQTETWEEGSGFKNESNELTGVRPEGRWPANVILSHSPECKVVGTRNVKGDQRGECGGKRPGGFANVGAEKGDGEPNAAVYGDEEIEVWECVPGCPVRMLDEQSGVSTRVDARTECDSGDSAIWGESNKTKTRRVQDFGGGASRYFKIVKPRFCYQAKASKRERTAGGTVENKHPTVKPLALMRYLCRLTKTPTGGVVLDPFAGSGTTLIAAVLEGRQAIGIEMNEEYCKVAIERVKRSCSQPRQLGLPLES